MFRDEFEDKQTKVRVYGVRPQMGINPDMDPPYYSNGLRSELSLRGLQLNPDKFILQPREGNPLTVSVVDSEREHGSPGQYRTVTVTVEGFKGIPQRTLDAVMETITQYERFPQQVEQNLSGEAMVDVEVLAAKTAKDLLYQEFDR